MVTKVNKKSLTNAELSKRLEELEQENSQLRNKDDDYGIRLDSYIEVMSLCPYKLNLSTEALGQGRRFSFSGFGEVKRILYNDLASIFEHYRSFMEEGYFYVMNEKVVRKHGLDDIYSKILNKEMILKVVNCDLKSAVKLYQNATKAQKEIIEGMLVQELMNNEDNLDLNIVAQISKIADKDLVKLAVESKQLEQAPV